MLRKKKGLPEEDELVLCKVSNIHYHSVFAKLEEYDNKTGMIHISEVSPGRIRNLRDYVKEGKIIICKVLKLDLQKGHIDLSLRRVNDAQKRIKLNQIKQEQLAESIIKQVAKKHKKPLEAFYNKLAKALLDEDYDNLYDVFEEVVSGERDLSEDIDKKIADDLTELILQRIKPPIVEIKGEFTIMTYEPNGVEIVKKALQAGEKTHDDILIRSKGAGKYGFVVSAKDYKEAESIMDDVKTAVLKYLGSHNAEGEFAKVE
ncbi:MAG: translation initiation factor IF-2 subunit alpha [Candidatus Nanoarchaeia archaeon]